MKVIRNTRSQRYLFLAFIIVRQFAKFVSRIGYRKEKVFDTVPFESAQFVADSNGISAEVYMFRDCENSQLQEFNAKGYPVKLGYFYKSGWTAGLPFYLFRCPGCKEFIVDYKHGHDPYLWCRECKTSFTFYSFCLNKKSTF